MNTEIKNFLKYEKFATICCVDDDGAPYCFTCMFAFNEEDGLLYFKSQSSSHHAMIMENNFRVSGTVLPVKPDVLVIKGLQFAGTVLPKTDQLTSKARRKYYSTFPLAVAIPGNIYTIQLEEMKLTDNSKGFGKKVHWNISEELLTTTV